MREKRTKLKYQGRHRSRRGIISMLLSLLVFAGVVTASAISGMKRGNAGAEVGYIGMLCFILAGVGFTFGILSLKERDILLFQPVFGVVVNGSLFFALVALYLTGIII